MENKKDVADPPMLLKDLILQVRQELVEAAAQSMQSGQAPVLSLDGVTLELNFVVESEQKVTAGASAKLLAVVGFKAGAEQKYSREQVHKVTVHLSGAKPPSARMSQTGNQLGSHRTSLPDSGSVPRSPTPEAPTWIPPRPLNFENICLRWQVGDETRLLTVKDIMDAAMKKHSTTTDPTSLTGLTIDAFEAFDLYGRKLK